MNKKTVTAVVGAAAVTTVLVVRSLLPTTYQVTLAWNTVTNAIGYNIYEGTNSRHYTTFFTVGQTNQFTVTGLQTNVTYYFVATSLGANRYESGYSTEISYGVGMVIDTNVYVYVTNFTYGRVDGLLVQTDKTYWPTMLIWTNAVPGYASGAYFRLISFGSNLWQYQIGHDIHHWSNTFGTMKSTFPPHLQITNLLTFCSGTNVTVLTNPPLDTNGQILSINVKPPMPSQ